MAKDWMSPEEIALDASKKISKKSQICPYHNLAP